ncbi:hypothetical protein GGF31_003113 [Allomyces arbusculus]|nr:hypothetical protein GGF31_003113 [Allomyces arbusculus]
MADSMQIDDAPQPYALAGTLLAHTQDVKDVAFLSADTLATVSRDAAVRIWNLAATDGLVGTPSETALAEPHTGYVNSVTRVQLEDGRVLVASGGADKLVHVHEAATGKSVWTLVGHSENVCALEPIPGVPGGIISGSWDKTARVWVNGECLYTLKGHQHAVWAVLAVNATHFLTASADKTIKVWEGAKCLATLPGHHDVVRGLAYLPSLDLFASCSNDASIRIWTRDGSTVQELHGHTSFIYRVVANPTTGEWISCGEDRTVRVWKDGELAQTIAVPSTSVWSVAISDAGDLAAACSDGSVYLYSRSPAKHAPADVLTTYEQALASFAIPKNQIGDLNKEKLPGPEALQSPGTKEGQILMVKTETSVEAHQWSMGQRKWVKVGDVVDAIGSGRKQVHDGKEYDYVFDIDLGNGSMLKLPYNVADNPYTAAQQFIWKHELSQEFLDQIAQFIVQNTRGETLGAGTASYADPFTGGSRYTPAAAPATATAPTAATNASAFNPWTSGYTSAAAAAAPPAAAPAPARRVPNRAPVLPVREFVTFKQINLAAVGKKIGEVAAASGVTLATTDVASNGWAVAAEIVQHPSWPRAQKFPALDVMRVEVLTLDGCGAKVVSAVESAIVGEPRADANAMVGFRAIANLFVLPGNRAAVIAALPTVLRMLNEYRVTSNKNLRQSVVTVLLNIAVHFVQTGSSEEVLDVLALLVEMVPGETDPETLYRAVAALGTVAAVGTPVKAYVNALEVGTLIRTVLGRTDIEGRTRDAAEDALALLP